MIEKQGRSDIIKFLKSFLIILIGIYLADWAVGYGLKRLYNKQTSGLQYLTSYSINTTKANCLVFGSSRATHHYDPTVFEQKTGLTFYNCGRPAQGLIYSCAVASAVLERYTPKCIIMDVRPEEFTTSDKGQLSDLFPYKDNPAIKKYFKYNGKFESVKFLSHIYPYNSIFASLLVGASKFGKKNYPDINGYIPYSGTITGTLPYIHESTLVNPDKLIVFKSLLAQLDKAHIPTLIIISPSYAVYNKNSTTVQLCSNLCSKYKLIKFLNFEDDTMNTKGKYFFNDLHMNSIGAKLFSERLVQPMLAVMAENAANRRVAAVRN